MPVRLATVWLALFVAAAPAPTIAQTTPAATTRDALSARARANGATDVEVHSAPAGGVTLVGKLEGDQFALSIPAGWKGGGLVYAHGYSMPGKPIAVSEDPVTADPSLGLLRLVYADGVAVAHSAHDKAGLGRCPGTTYA